MISIADARRAVLERAAPLRAVRVPLDTALARVLADPVVATMDVPPFANSAMDGFALRAADTNTAPVWLRIVGAVMAGGDPTVSIGPGEAARIMTGAALPIGADAVCMFEHTFEEPDGMRVLIDGSVEFANNIRQAGEDVTEGTEVFGAHSVLTPAHIGVLASIGVDSVRVYPAPRVGVVSTGDELCATTMPLGRATIHDANGPALVAQLRADGWDASDLGIVNDDETALSERIESGAAHCDVVVTSGGVSVGDRDVVTGALDKLCDGNAQSFQVAVRPAKPFAFGTLSATRTPVFALPGNPVSALVSYELFVRPALRTMAGHLVVDRPRLRARTTVDLPRQSDGKVHLVRVRARAGADGGVFIEPVGGQGAHMLNAMAGANAFAVLDDGHGVRTGESVDILLIDAAQLAGPEAGPLW
jgi:molybdopterin molybdotransferase